MVVVLSGTGDKKLKQFTVSFLLIALIASMAGNASAADPGDNALFNARFAFYLGGFFPQVSSTIRLDGKILGDGDELSFENAFGLEDSKTVLWGGARWRISRRNMLEFEMADLTRSC
jgi:hypothetical protein